MRVAIIKFSIKDAKSNIRTTDFYVDLETFGSIDGDAIGEVIEYFQEVAQRLDVLLGGCISNISLSLNIPLPSGIKLFANNDSDVEEKAKFVYPKTALSEAYYNHAIPAFDHSIFDTIEKIEFGQESTIDYLTTLLFNPTEAEDWPSEIGGITDHRGEPIVSAPTVYKRFVKSGGF